MAAWTPELENNIGLWDPSVSGNVTQSSNLVSQISDTSGNSKHLVQATGSLKPSTNTRTLNGLNVIDTDGSNYMTVALTLPTSGNYLFTGVFGIDAVDNALDTIFTTTGASSFSVGAGSASEFDAKLVGATAFTSVTPSPVVAYSAATIFAVLFDFSNTTVTLYTNGTQVAQATYTTVLTVASIFAIFVDKAGAQGLDGFMAYMAICKSFSTETLQRFEGFYAHRFGLTSSLPGAHPYKTTAPQVVPFAADAAAVSTATGSLTTGVNFASDATAVSTITAALAANLKQQLNIGIGIGL